MPSKPKPTRKDEPTQNAKDKSCVQGADTQHAISSPLSHPQLPPSNAHYQIACNPEKDWWDENKKWVEIAGLFLLAIYTLFTIKMSCATEESADATVIAANAAKLAADTAHESLVVSNRPWLSLEITPASDLSYHGSTAYLKVLNIATNYGLTPAVSARVDDEIVEMNHETLTPEREAERFCDTLVPTKSGDVWAKILRQTIFPKTPSERMVSYEFSVHPSGKAIVPVVIGCAVYKSSFDNSWLRTWKIYQLDVPGTLPGTVFVPEAGKTIPKKNILLVPYSSPEESK